MEITYGASTRLQVSHETIKDCHFLPEIGLEALDDMPHPNPTKKGNIRSCLQHHRFTVSDKYHAV